MLSRISEPSRMEPDSSLIIRGFSAPLNAARNILALLPNIKDLQHADEIFQKHFNCLPAEEKLPVALELFDTYQTIELGVLEFLDKVWTDVTIERNYRPHFSSLDALKSAISFSTRVEPLQKRWLEVKRASSYRLREVEKNWGGSVETVIPEDYLPKKGAFGRNTVNALVNFGQHVSSPEEAKSLLLKAIQQRAPRAARKSPIGPADVSRAICMRSRQDAPIPNRLATTEPSSTQRTTRSQTLDTRRVTKRKRGNETELISPPSPPASSDTTTDDLHPEPQERTSTDPADHSVGINQNADQGRSTATIDPALTDEPQPSSPLSCEKCHPSIVNILSDYHTLKKWLGVDEGPQLGQSIYKSGLDKVCYQHLRLICAASYNLVNSKQTDELRERFCVCCKAHDEAALDNIRSAQRH